MALFRKLFYRKPPDGLLEICERVFVFDSCFAADALEQQDYKGYVKKIISQLKEHYPNASILAFNFREGETQSQVANALTEYDTTIMEYPRHYEGCPLLPMEVMHHFLRSSESWLSLGQQNVLFMHCERGGWPVLAFTLAALLLYRKHYSGEQRTLEMVYKQGPREVLQSFSHLNPVPSQLRYLQYVSRRNVASEWPPLDRGLNLDCIIIRTIPDVDGEGGCRPIFRLYGQDPLQVSNQTPKVLFSTPKQSKTVRFYKQAECELAKIDINCPIQGDVVMECINLHDNTEREEMIFRVMFNAAFIRSNILILNRDEIDILWNTKDRFPKDFRAEVLFSEMDTAASVVPVDYFHFEEKDGLPIEAFGKVQEIFSGVDWLGPKGDNAIEGIQQSHAEKSHINQSVAATADVDRKQSDPQHSPSGIGAIVTPEKTLTPHEDHIVTSSALTPQQHSDGEVLNFASKQQSDSNSIQGDMAKDVIPQTEADTSYLKTSPSTSTSQLTKDDAVGLEQLLMPPVILNAATSPSKDENSRSHDKITKEESPKSGGPPLTASLKKDANDTAPHTENSVSTSHQIPVAPSPSSASPLKENSTLEVGPSTPPPATLHMTDSAANGVGACPPPRPMPPTESPAVKGVDSVSPTVPQPPSISSVKGPPNSEAVPQPPSTSPSRDNSVAKHAPPPPPPPENSSGEKSTLTPHPTYSGHRAPPPLPPPPLDPHLRDTSTIRHAPCPPPPSSGPPPPPPPAPPNHHGSNTSNSSSIPSAPPPPLPSTKQTPGAPTPPPPSVPPPGAKGKSLLSHGANSKNSQTNKLKPLHWLKISRAVSGSLWAEAQKSGEAAKAPEIDMSELESLFSAAAPNTNKGNKTGPKASATPKPEKVQLIDHRRAYNCEIMLSKVKMPLPDMLNSVLALEDSVLDVDQVDNLIKFCPTKEEMEMLKGYKGERDKLGKCERFFLELMQVPRIEYKLRVFSFKIQFRSQVSELRHSLNVVTSAADQIKGSAKFKKIMQTILSLGNALNQGTARGSAVGFRLDSLLKLTETRARNNKMTLMHYLCKVLSDKLPELLDFWKDLSSLEPASKVQLKFLAEEMQIINKGLEKVVQELTMSENDGDVSVKFCKALKDFLRFAEGEVRPLASLYSGVGRNVDSLILYFGEDPARCPYEQVVTTLVNFVRMFRQAHEENLKQQEADKKKAEKEASEKPKKINEENLKQQEADEKNAEKEASEKPTTFNKENLKQEEVDKRRAEKEAYEKPKTINEEKLKQQEAEKADSEKPKKINASEIGQLLQASAGSVK